MGNEWKIYDDLDKEDFFYDWTTKMKNTNRRMQGRRYEVSCVIYSRENGNDRKKNTICKGSNDN